MAKVNTDAYKPLVLGSEKNVDPYKFSQLAQEEASIIHSKVFARLEALAKEGRAPHTLIDQVFIGSDKLVYGSMNQGTVTVYVVSTEVASAVERSYERGKETGRFEATRSILDCHKRMSQDVPKTLAEFHNKNPEAKLFLVVNLVDNNGPRGQKPKLVMYVGFLEHIIKVFRYKELRRFILKENINIDARSSLDLYLPNKVSVVRYLHPLIDSDFSLDLLKMLAPLNREKRALARITGLFSRRPEQQVKSMHEADLPEVETTPRQAHRN